MKHWLTEEIKPGTGISPLFLLASLIPLLVAILVLLFATNAHSQYSCEQVRSYVGSVGKDQATANAKAAGATSQQLRTARRCMRKGR
jgi:hypothetical protein